jgi:hypothetical protein
MGHKAENIVWLFMEKKLPTPTVYHIIYFAILVKLINMLLKERL